MRFSIFLAAAGLVADSAAMGENTIQVVPGLAAAYEGAVEIKQTVGDESSTEGKFEATLVLRLREASSGKLEAYIVRMLKPTESNEAPMVGFDEADLIAKPRGFKLEARGAAAAELEEGTRELSNFFPLTLLPEFDAPPGGSGGNEEAEVSVLDSLPVKAQVVVSAMKVGEGLELSRKLAGGSSPELKVRDEASKLVAWSELFRFESTKTLPSRIERRFAIEGKVADTRVRYEQTLLLSLKRKSDGKGEEGARLDSVERELREIAADFALFKSPDEISKRVAAFSTLAKGTILESANAALAQRLKLYKASGLGKIAPDFTLESLDGKQVSFREFSRGKVVLLSFWGVG